MKTPTQDNYALLKKKLETWKTCSESRTQAVQQAFLLAARESLVPELTSLATVMSDAGMECEVFQEHDNLAVGIRIPALQTVLSLSPTEGPAFLRAVLARRWRPGDEVEWFIPYHLIRKGGLGRELQSAVVSALKTE